MAYFRIRKRDEPLRRGGLLILLAALAFSLSISFLILALWGKSPVHGALVLWEGSFGSSWALGDSLLKAVPIFLCSLGVAVAFRMQIWNIGAEGQYALGAIGATWAALTFPQAPWYVLMPLMFICSAVLGGLWAAIPAYLRLKLRVNEIITTLMMNYIAIQVLDYLVYGIWKDPVSFGFPMTSEFTEGAVIGLIGDSRYHYGLVMCVALGFLLWAFFRYTRLGFELKSSGQGVRVAAYSRMPYGFLVMFVMIVSGAFAGLAGYVETSAVLNRLQPSVMAGYGYTAIVVAWLAKLKPSYIAVAAYLLAALRVGVENLQLELQLPAAFGSIMEGLILLTVLAGQMFTMYTITRRK